MQLLSFGAQTAAALVGDVSIVQEKLGVEACFAFRCSNQCRLLKTRLLSSLLSRNQQGSQSRIARLRHQTASLGSIPVAFPTLLVLSEPNKGIGYEEQKPIGGARLIGFLD